MSTSPQPTSVSPPAHGFGSFHTERDEDRIDHLIALPEDEYTPPHLPVNIDLSSYPLPFSPFDDTANSIASENQQQIVRVPFGRETLETWYHIDPEWTFVNHGAFGATFKPVSEAESLWHRYMESQPLRFIDRKLLPLLVYTTRRLGQFIGVSATDLVILPNVTTGLNTILNSIDWYSAPELPLLGSETGSMGPSDNVVSETSKELSAAKVVTATTTIATTATTKTTTITTLQSFVITFDTGYGATKQMIKSIKDRYGLHVVHQDLHLTLPISSPKEVTQLLRHAFRKHQRDNTLSQIKLVIVDYIQSNSALVFPIEELCALCNQYNIPVLIDGAHSLGSYDLNISAMKSKPTFFVANAHKWLCSGKGVSLLYINPDQYAHDRIKPAVVSHGYSSETLADCWNTIGVSSIRKYLHSMLNQVAEFLVFKWNTDLLGPISMFGTMVCVRLPGPRVPQNGSEHTDLQDALYFKYNIEVPIKMLQNRLYVRVSCHIYNDWTDFRKLAQALLELRPKLTGDDDQRDIEHAETAAAVTPFTSCG